MTRAFRTYFGNVSGAGAGGSAGLGSRIRALARAFPRQLAKSLLVAAVVPQPGLAKRQPTSRRAPEATKVWRARYVGGTLTADKRGQTLPLAEGSRVRVRFEEDRILVFQKKRLVSIPAATVSELDYRAQVFSRSRKVFGKEGFSQSVANCAGDNPQGAWVCLAEGLPLYAATAPFHYQEHFIHIAWRAASPTNDEYDDEEQEMELRVGKGEFRGLITALERATGKKCDRIEIELREGRK